MHVRCRYDRSPVLFSGEKGRWQKRIELSDPPPMVLPTGLLPVFAFVLTVGISVPVAIAAHLTSGSQTQLFGRALRVSLLEAGLLYLVGVIVVWAIAGGGLNMELWEIPTTLVITGIMSLLVLAVLPLVVGQHLVQRLQAVDSETGLRYATYGWPIAMLAVFGIFVIPDGEIYGAVCFAGFCGVAGSSAPAILLGALVAVLGPGVVGVLIAAR